MKRDTARQRILEAANRHRPKTLPVLYMRHLQLAVFKCRQRGLVDGSVLADAGFNAKRGGR